MAICSTCFQHNLGFAATPGPNSESGSTHGRRQLPSASSIHAMRHHFTRTQGYFSSSQGEAQPHEQLRSIWLDPVTEPDASEYLSSAQHDSFILYFYVRANGVRIPNT